MKKKKYIWKSEKIIWKSEKIPYIFQIEFLDLAAPKNV